MKIEEALKLQQEAHQRQIALRKGKSHDYADDEDCIKNIKILAAIAKVFKDNGIPIDLSKSYETAFWYHLQKDVRLQNLWSQEKEPKNESLNDTLDDGVKYYEIARDAWVDYLREKNGIKEIIDTLVKISKSRKKMSEKEAKKLEESMRRLEE